jgi:hypothetical protein
MLLLLRDAVIEVFVKRVFRFVGTNEFLIE